LRVLSWPAASRDGSAGDKAPRQLRLMALLADGIARAALQVASMARSVNANLTSFRSFGLPLLVDSVPSFEGSLAGILAGMDWAASQGSEILASVACDPPLPARPGGVSRCDARRGKCQDCLRGFPYGSRQRARSMTGPRITLWRLRHFPLCGSIRFSTSPRRQTWQKRGHCLPWHVRLIIAIPGCERWEPVSISVSWSC
jgi:hypothetical protein